MSLSESEVGMTRTVKVGRIIPDGYTSPKSVELEVRLSASQYHDTKTKTLYTKGQYFSVCGGIWNNNHSDYQNTP